MIRILLLDNHDSFTFNLAELLRHHRKVTFNMTTAEGFAGCKPELFDKFLISPGPGHPDEHPVIFELLDRFSPTRSILGICLGLQAIALHSGGKLFNLEHPVHGQARTVHIHPPAGKLFNGLPLFFDAGLYHSWAVDRHDVPPELKITALSEEGIIMALSHEKFDVCGVQFHPESIMTPLGSKILENWINA